MSNRIIAACATVLAGFYFWGIANIRVPRVGDPLGPRAFPIVIGTGLLIAAALLVLESRRGARQAKAAPKPEEAPEADEGPNVRVVAGAVGVTAIYYLAFEPLGFLISTTAYLGVLTLYFYKGSRFIALASSAGFALVTYLCFNKLLGARLPGGLLPL